MKKEYQLARQVEQHYLLWINDKITLHDIDADFFSLILIYVSAYQNRKKEKDEMKQKIDEIFGRNK
jgi:hypothetical protein